MQYLVNGELVPQREARLHVSDLGLVRGYALFDFFRVVRGVPLFLEDYLDRFFRSAALLSLEPPATREKLHEQVLTLVQANALQDAAIKLLLTGGYSEDGFTSSTPNLLGMVQEAAPKTPDFQKGIHLMTHRYTRDLPEVKTTNYAQVLALQLKLRAVGAADVLYHDGTHVTESSRSNVFIVDGSGAVRTPTRDILRGVTRKHVLAISREHYETAEGEVTLEEVRGAKEVFMTSSTKGVLPVTMMDGVPVGDGRPGKVTRELAARFAEHVEVYLKAASPTTS